MSDGGHSPCDRSGSAIRGTDRIPEVNRAAVLQRPRTITLTELPVPEPGEREVLVEVASVGVCGSDVHYYEEGRIGDFVVRAPLVLGHEASGIVVARGPHADRLEPGTLVAIEPGVPCRRCVQCRSGRYNLCPEVRFLATPPVHGAFARYLAIPEDFCHPAEPSLSADTAALVEPLSVGVWACRKAAVGLGDQVLVTGAGAIGLLTALVARAAGAVPTVCDVNPQRLARAREIGIERTADVRQVPIGELGPHDVFIECSGAKSVAGPGLAALRPFGRAVLVGMSATGEVTLPLSVIQNRELVVTGSFRYANTYPTAVALAASGAVPLADIIDVIYPLNAVKDALEATRRDPSLIKVIVHPSEIG